MVFVKSLKQRPGVRGPIGEGRVASQPPGASKRTAPDINSQWIPVWMRRARGPAAWRGYVPGGGATAP